MKSRANLLAEFTDLLNKNGAESPLLKEFCAQYETDKVLSKLFATAVRMQAQLRGGALSMKPGDLDAAKPTHQAASSAGH